MSLDGEVDTSDLKLSRFPDANIYYPNDSYCGSFALPPEWMEAFERDQPILESEEKVEYFPTIDMEKVTPEKSSPKRISASSSTRNLKRSGTWAKSTPLSCRNRQTITEIKNSTFLELVAESSAPPDAIPVTEEEEKEDKITIDIPEPKTAESTRIKKAIKKPMLEKIRKREKAHENRPTKKMFRSKSQKIVKKLKKIVKYKGLPNHLFYMKSPYGSILKATQQLPVFRITKSKRSTSARRPSNI